MNLLHSPLSGALAAAVLTLAATAPSLASAEDGRVIVRFKAESTAMRAQALSAKPGHPRQAFALTRRTGLALEDGKAISARTQVVRVKGMSSQALAAKLAADPDVEYAVVDGRAFPLDVPNDPRYASGQQITPVVGQWFLRAPDDTLVSAINAEGAWDVTKGKASVVVAVLDTGVRKDHPDLAGKLVGGYDFISDKATANDGNGRDSDASDPGDWVSQDEIGTSDFPTSLGCTVEDSKWHGTKTAGLIGAATDNGVGIASVGRDVKVVPVRVLGKCGGDDSDIQAAMRWAAGLHVDGVPDNENPARVLNMSLGAEGESTCTKAYQDVVDELRDIGVVVVAAAGNAGKAVGRPANCNGVIAVTGLRHNGLKVGYSNLGSKATIAAPAGNCVNTDSTCLYTLLSTTNSGTTTPKTNTYTDGDNTALYGTSFASPLVAGTIGLMLSERPNLTVKQITTLLTSTARDFPTTGGDPGIGSCQAPSNGVVQDIDCYCTTDTCGAGMLSASAALKATANLSSELVAAFTSSSSRLDEGDSVDLDAGNSTGAGSNAVSDYRWAITSGAVIAKLSSTDTKTTTVSTSGAGTFSVRLTITDSGGGTATTSKTFTVAAKGDEDGDDEGGGASSLLWLGLLASAVLALAMPRPKRSRIKRHR